MSVFGKIMDAIFGKDHPAPAPSPTVDTTQSPGSPPPPPPAATPAAMAQSSRSAAVDQVDVENNLDNMPGADHLNWRTSIVDLMKLVGIDSDYESRKALANELGNGAYSGTAEDNVRLHKQLMQGLSRNGGKVPAEYID